MPLTRSAMFPSGIGAARIPDADLELFCTKAMAYASSHKGGYSPALLAMKTGRVSC